MSRRRHDILGKSLISCVETFSSLDTMTIPDFSKGRKWLRTTIKVTEASYNVYDESHVDRIHRTERFCDTTTSSLHPGIVRQFADEVHRMGNIWYHPVKSLLSPKLMWWGSQHIRICPSTVCNQFWLPSLWIEAGYQRILRSTGVVVEICRLMFVLCRWFGLKKHWERWTAGGPSV